MGPQQQAMQKAALLQAKGERETLKLRVATTEESIRVLVAGLPASLETDAPLSYTDSMLLALIHTNLTQLRANLKEGTDRLLYLDSAIQQAESPVHKATLVHPAR